MKHRTTLSIGLALGLMNAVACGGDDPADPSSTCDEQAKGFISCGDFNQCQPGQYCSDETFGTCSTGCLADVNCGCGQVCELPPGQSVGMCKLPVQSECGNGTCDPGETSASCSRDCAPPNPCGNGLCDPGETAASCARDCTTADPCGDGVCEDLETFTTCPADCDASLCKAECSSYDFFECLGPGQLQACWDRCNEATAAQTQQFIGCLGAIECDMGCLQFLP